MRSIPTFMLLLVLAFACGDGEGIEEQFQKWDEHCGLSWDCQLRGLCATDRDDPSNFRCIAIRDADCAVSDACRKNGGCTVYKKACMALSDTDCTASAGCISYGDCYSFFFASTDRWVCGCQTDRECKASLGCGGLTTCECRNSGCFKW